MRGTQLVLMTSAGRLLEGTVKGPDGMALALREVLEGYARLPEMERRAKHVDGEIRPQPSPPANGLVLTIYDRPLARDRDGRYRLPEKDDLGGLHTHAPHGQRSSLWLKEREWKSLVPSEPKKGQVFPVAAKLAKRIWLYGLVPQTLWVVEEMWKADAVREGELFASVVEATAETVRLRLYGSVLLASPGILHTWPDHKFIKNIENRYSARLEGEVIFDRARNRISRFDVVVLGDFSGRWFAGEKGWKEATVESPLALAFAFELDTTAFDLPPERRRPRSFVHAYIFRTREDHYWDPEAWLTDWNKTRTRPK